MEVNEASPRVKIRSKAPEYFKRLLPYFEKPVLLSTKKIQEIWGLSIYMTRRHLKFLVAWNYLVCVKAGRYKYYTLPTIWAKYAKKLHLLQKLKEKV